MLQDIGIQFSATGATQVAASVNKIVSALEHLERAASKLSNFKGIFQNQDPFKGSTASIRHLITEMKAAESAARNLSTAMANISRASNGIRNAGVPPAPSVPPTPGVPAQNTRQGTRHGLMDGYMAYQVANAARRTAKELILSTSRGKLKEGLAKMRAIDFDEEMRNTSESMGREYLKNNWAAGDMNTYMKSVAEAGSAIPPDDKRFGGDKKRGVVELNKMAQAIMSYSKMADIGTDEGGRLLMGAINARLQQMPNKERTQYETGQKSTGDLANKMAGQLTEGIKVTSAWGTDYRHGLKYSLPTALSKGWDFEQLLSIIGVMKTGGFEGQKFGRGLKTILEGQKKAFSKLFIAGDDDPVKWQDFKSKKGKDQKNIIESMVPQINEQLKGDKAPLFFQELGKKIDMAEKRGIDLENIGISKEWVNIIRQMSKPGVVEQWKKVDKQIRGVQNLSGVEGSLQEVQGDPAYNADRLINSFDHLKQAVEKTNKFKEFIDSWATVMDDMTQYIGKGGDFSGKDVIPEVGTMAKSLGSTFFDIGKFIPNMIGSYLNSIMPKLQEMIPSIIPKDFQLPDLSKVTFDGLLEKISSGFSKAIDSIKNFNFDQLFDFKSLQSNVESKVKDFADSLKSKLSSAIDRAIEGIKSVPGRIKESLLPKSVDNLNQIGRPKGQADAIPQQDTVIKPGDTLFNPTAPVRPMSYNPNEDSMVNPNRDPMNSTTDALMQLAGLAQNSGGKEGGEPSIRITIGNQEIKDFIAEVVAEQKDGNSMQNYGRFGQNSFAPGV